MRPLKPVLVVSGIALLALPATVAAQDTARICLDIQTPAYAIDLSDPTVVQQEIVLGNVTLLDVVDCAVTGDASGSAEDDAATSESEPSPEAEVQLDRPNDYKKLSRRDWQRLVKSPDRYSGNGYQIWACIFQFDSATGDEGFLAMASHGRLEFWFTDGETAAFTGDAALLEDFVEEDVVTMRVVGQGSYSYDTQAGGNTTVPTFEVVSIKRERGTC